MRAGPLPGGAPVGASLWLALNRAMIAKTIGELTFEEAFAPEPTNREGTQWLLRLAGGIAYRFSAERRIWGNLAIDPASLFRIEGSLVTPAGDAAGFMVDAGETLGIEAATLCTYVKEMLSTLTADARIAAIGAGLDGPALLALSDRTLQQYLDGHPKAPASKGRIGWGLSDFESYAPEFQAGIRLYWVAADREACRISLEPGLVEGDLVADALDEVEQARLADLCRERGVTPARHLLLPVHPWQWDTMIALQFASEIAAGRLIPLGTFGRPYLAQQSLRTLASADGSGRLDVKLALTVLNTSAWRGVPGKYMAVGPAFSAWLARKAAEDPALQGVVILRERAGAFYPHPVYERVEGAPYQFREMLGVIWRDGIAGRLGPGRNALMMGALLKADSGGRPLISSLIARSGLSPEAWLERLFDHVAVPLYHFLCAYGVGFIAHGQNVTLVLDGAIPCGVALKDLQGDVDLVDQDFPESADLPACVRDTLLRRPAAHLLQHLQTGHFASVLRFVSDALLRHDGLPEIAFYAALARSLRRYQAGHPELAARHGLFALFAPTVPRVCINRVRLALGYGDSNLRPVPRLGTDLINPLHRAERSATDMARIPRIMTTRPLDLAGIGIGPFNLSLAAQLDAVDDIDALFFDRSPAFDWHPGMMLPDVTLQTSFLKDLVTAANPTSPWSFMAYLVAQKRFYEFLNAEFEAVPRQEFAQYLAWVAGRLPSLRFGTAIHEARFERGAFVLATDGEALEARNLAIGVGLQPNLPDFASKLGERDHFHTSGRRIRTRADWGQRVAVIGGGQSGAEIVLHLLNRTEDAPAQVDWISRRPNFQPLDATPFTNELFTPQYVGSFHGLPEPRRRSTRRPAEARRRRHLRGDPPGDLPRLYTLRHIENAPIATALLPHREVLDVDRSSGYRLVMRNGFDGSIEVLQTDVIVLATGYRYALPDCLDPIRHRLSLDAAGRPQANADFSAAWDGPARNRIFVLNSGLVSHGIAEPQLSLMAWRSAVIANAIAERCVFDTELPPSPITWSGAGAWHAPLQAGGPWAED